MNFQIVKVSNRIRFCPKTHFAGISKSFVLHFKNLFSVLETAGLNANDVQKVNVFLTSMGDFACMNEVYKQQFKEPYPARSTIAVAGLPLNAKIEIELIAKRKS